MQIAGTSHDESLELHAAEPISHHGFGDTQNLADSGLPAPYPITRMRGGGEAGNQRAVEIEERTHLGTR